jgi:chaperone required for assembly of F1-ATPase
MREFLEDANEHRDDGYGRAQAHVRQTLPKRFYQETGVGVADGGFTVTLDNRATRTPGQVPVVVPSADIATAMAAEWALQGAEIDPLTMPLVRLINSAIESGESKVPALREEIVKYAGNDLLLYRADGPGSLVAAQEALWDDALVKLARYFGIGFQPTIGILHQEQPRATLDKLAAALENENVFVLSALNSITNLTGSGLLAIAIWHRLLSPDEAWLAAHVDEDFQQSQWGTVEEAASRRVRRRAEFDAAVSALEMLRL